MKKLPSQPDHTIGNNDGGTAAPGKKDNFNSDSVAKKGNYHQAPKARQDGKTSKRGPDSKDGLWQHHHSLPGEKHA